MITKYQKKPVVINKVLLLIPKRVLGYDLPKETTIRILEPFRTKQTQVKVINYTKYSCGLNVTDLFKDKQNVEFVTFEVGEKDTKTILNSDSLKKETA